MVGFSQCQVMVKNISKIKAGLTKTNKTFCLDNNVEGKKMHSQNDSTSRLPTLSFSLPTQLPD